MKNYRLRIFIISLLCILTLLCGCKGNASSPKPSKTTPTSKSETQELDWTMHGVYFREGSNNAEDIAFSVKGSIYEPADEAAVLELVIALPDDFRYSLEAYNTTQYRSDGKVYNVSYHMWIELMYDRNIQSPIAVFCGLDEEKQFMIIQWISDGENQYILASADPSVSTEEIQEHFHVFLDRYSGTQSTNPLEINWAMDGMMVDAQGNVISNGSLAVNGRIEKSENSDDNIYLYFTLPQTLHYILDERVEEQMPYRPAYQDEFSFYVCSAYCYSTKDNRPVAFMFALDVEAGYLIMQWENLPGQFLITSRDGTPDPQQIMNHFQTFLDKYAFAK